MLIARAAEARDVLPEALAERGAAGRRRAALRDGPRAGRRRRRSRRAADADYVTFTSSSTVRYFVETVGDRFPRRRRVVSIGPVTSDDGPRARPRGRRRGRAQHDPDGLRRRRCSPTPTATRVDRGTSPGIDHLQWTGHGAADHLPHRLRRRRRLRRRLPRRDRADRARHRGHRHQPRDRPPRRPRGVGGPRRRAPLRAGRRPPRDRRSRRRRPAPRRRRPHRPARATSSSAPTTACCRRRSTCSAAPPRRSTSATRRFRLEPPLGDLPRPRPVRAGRRPPRARRRARRGRRRRSTPTRSSASPSRGRGSSSSAPSPTPSGSTASATSPSTSAATDLDGHPLAGAGRVSVGSRKRRRTATRAAAFEQVADGGFLFYEDSSGRMAIADQPRRRQRGARHPRRRRGRAGAGAVDACAPARRRASASPHHHIELDRLDQPAGQGARRSTGAPSGTVVTAAEQSAGRGRGDRRLDGAAGRGAALLGDPAAARPRATCCCRWPCRSRSARRARRWRRSTAGSSGRTTSGSTSASSAGILIEARPPDWAVIGVGINLSIEPDRVPRRPALAGDLARPRRRRPTRCATALDEALGPLGRGRPGARPRAVPRPRRAARPRDRPGRAARRATAAPGVGEGIDERGNLLVRGADGELSSLGSGEVQLKLGAGSPARPLGAVAGRSVSARRRTLAATSPPSLGLS